MDSQVAELIRRVQRTPAPGAYRGIAEELAKLRARWKQQPDRETALDLAELLWDWAEGVRGEEAGLACLDAARLLVEDAQQTLQAGTILGRALARSPTDAALYEGTVALLSDASAYSELDLALHSHVQAAQRAGLATEVLVRCWKNLGRLRYESLQDAPGAIAAYERALDLAPDLGSVQWLAHLYQAEVILSDGQIRLPGSLDELSPWTASSREGFSLKPTAKPAPMGPPNHFRGLSFKRLAALGELAPKPWSGARLLTAAWACGMMLVLGLIWWASQNMLPTWLAGYPQATEGVVTAMEPIVLSTATALEGTVLEQQLGRVVLAARATSSQGGRLDQSELLQALLQVRNAAHRCYAQGLSGGSDAGGRLRLIWTIDPEGTALRPQTVTDTLEQPSTRGCVERALLAAPFPVPQGGAAQAATTFVFLPDQA